MSSPSLDQVKPDRTARATVKSKVVHLHKGAVWIVNGTVVVYQRLLFFGLGPKAVFVLPGCEGTNRDKAHVRRPSGLEAATRRRLRLPSFTKNSAM